MPGGLRAVVVGLPVGPHKTLDLLELRLADDGGPDGVHQTVAGVPLAAFLIKLLHPDVSGVLEEILDGRKGEFLAWVVSVAA